MQLQNVLNNGKPLLLSGSNLEFDPDDQSQGVFITSSAAIKRQNVVSLIEPSRVIVQTDLPLYYQNNVEMRISLSARFGKEIRQFQYPTVCRTVNVVDGVYPHLFVIDGQTSMRQLLEDEYEEPLIYRLRTRTDGKLAFCVRKLSGIYSEEVELAVAGGYSVNVPDSGTGISFYIGNVEVQRTLLDRRGRFIEEAVQLPF